MGGAKPIAFRDDWPKGNWPLLRTEGRLYEESGTSVASVKTQALGLNSAGKKMWIFITFIVPNPGD